VDDIKNLWDQLQDLIVTLIADGFMVPIGGIIMWSGTTGDIPPGWSLCDGSNGTPNLSGKFIVSAGGAYGVGDTGGADEVDISHDHAVGTLANDTLGAHVHTISGASASDGAHTHAGGTLQSDYDAHTHTSGSYATDSDSHTHTSGSYATDSDSHTHGQITTESAGGTGGTTFIEAITIQNDAHTHDVTGTSASDNHSHDVTGSSASDSHRHDIDTGATASDGAHTHGVGTFANDSQGDHVHTITGSVATGGNATHDNRPAYYAIAFIMRIE
jgi:hypothetical protein